MGKNLEEISVEQLKSVYDAKSFIGNDLVIMDRFEEVAILREAHRMNGLFFAFCQEGSARYTVDYKEHVVRKNDIIIISRGQVVDGYELSDDCRGIAFLFDYGYYGEVMKDVHEMALLFLFSRQHPVFNLNEQTAELFRSYFSIIKQRVDDVQHLYRDELVRTLIKAFIYDVGNVIWWLQHSSGERRMNRAESLFFDFLRLVEQNFRHERRVGWYGQQLGISPKHLSETVRQVSGRTPNDWIDTYVTTEMRVQLRNTSKSIKELAEELHFANQSFFGKYFKEHVGMSPSDYRKS